MNRIFPMFLLLTACAGTGDPMPYLNSTQRACLAQARAAAPIKVGQEGHLFVDKQGHFSGTVTDNGFTRYTIDAAPYDKCVAAAAQVEANAGLSEVAPGVLLNAADKALWDTLTAAQRQRGLTFIANGGTLQSSLGDV